MSGYFVRALFDHSYVDGELLIIDIGRDAISVTNDAENVIAKLAATYAETWPPKLVIYRDSTGTWDGIALDAAGRFARFYSLQETDKARALEKARARAIAR